MKRVVFLHPDLGIGGAERAMIDAAIALKSRGNEVHFVTAHHDPKHCFAETVDGTVDVTSVGDWLPRKLFGKFYALFAYIRMIYAAIYLVFFSKFKFDLVICDQISACIPVLLASRKLVIFYCHFPDMLLTQRKSILKKIYRFPIDWLEEWTTGLAHKVLVNSKFTSGIFHETFKSLHHIQPQVVYPIPDFSSFENPVEALEADWLGDGKTETVFVSINRYERKKNLSLAIEALAALGEMKGTLEGVQLIIAGGYDERVTENKEYYIELLKLAEHYGLSSNVTFLRSISNTQKLSLLAHATCLLYTPDKEHFGIVPVEAMYMKCPVIAVSSGGPLETVENDVTGFHMKQTPQDFADAMGRFVGGNAKSKEKARTLKTRMGEAGKQRVLELFSFDAYATKLSSIVSDA